MDVLFTIARSWHTPKAKSGCTAHEFGKLTHFLRWYGCTVHDSEKLTHTKSKKWMYGSWIREADTLFKVIWMYRSRNREADIHFKATLCERVGVQFTISRSRHPFWGILDVRVTISRSWHTPKAKNGCTVHDFGKLTSILGNIWM